MHLYHSGRWRTTGRTAEVVNPFDGAVIDTVPVAGAGDVDAALAGLVGGAKTMRALSARRRGEILRTASARLDARAEEFGRLISTEEGKILGEGVGEARRAVETLRLSAEEALRIGGEVLPMDAAPNGVNFDGTPKLGFTVRVPCGVAAAICPFNFPLNLVCHKVGPALAAGNAVLLKPAGDTPLSALKLVELLLECGLPGDAVACLTGPGKELGEAVCTDRRVRKITFTGSDAVGEQICRWAGVKRVTMELGSNCPLVVLDDADPDVAAKLIAKQGTANAGQVCISCQRVLVEDGLHGDLRDALAQEFAALSVGDQLAEGTDVGPLVRERDAVRVTDWLDEAVAAGAERVVGGERRGSLVTPAVLDGVTDGMRVVREELFGPAVVVQRFDDIDRAIAAANGTRYGLAAGLLTNDVGRALRFVREVDAGVLNIGGGPQYRADLMPYGGLGASGLGKEGPKYAVEAMTESKCVVWHG